MDKDARIFELEAALEFYTNPSDYKAPFITSKIWLDCGTIARVALNEQYGGDVAAAAITNVSPYRDISS